jgi:hypothetical protein
MTDDLSWPLTASVIDPNANAVKTRRKTNEVFNVRISHSLLIGNFEKLPSTENLSLCTFDPVAPHGSTSFHYSVPIEP